MGTICRTIEVDLRQMPGETELPPAYETRLTRHGPLYLD
jgi:hypothetical protein